MRSARCKTTAHLKSIINFRPAHERIDAAFEARSYDSRMTPSRQNQQEYPMCRKCLAVNQKASKVIKLTLVIDVKSQHDTFTTYNQKLWTLSKSFIRSTPPRSPFRPPPPFPPHSLVKAIGCEVIYYQFSFKEQAAHFILDIPL